MPSFPVAMALRRSDVGFLTAGASASEPEHSRAAQYGAGPSNANKTGWCRHVRRQALVLEAHASGLRLLNISGLVSLDEQSPYLVWLGHARAWLHQRLTGGEPQWLTTEDAAQASEIVRSGWEEWWHLMLRYRVMACKAREREIPLRYLPACPADVLHCRIYPLSRALPDRPHRSAPEPGS